MSKRKFSLKPLTLKVQFIGKTRKRQENISLDLEEKTSVKPSELDKATTSATTTATTSTAVTFDDFFSVDGASRTYESRKLKAIQKWAELRQTLIDAAIEEQSIATNTMCSVCSSNDAEVRCTFCGPRQYFCRGCGIEEHKERNYFHVMELWQVKLKHTIDYYLLYTIILSHTLRYNRKVCLFLFGTMR